MLHWCSQRDKIRELEKDIEVLADHIKVIESSIHTLIDASSKTIAITGEHRDLLEQLRQASATVGELRGSQ